MKIEVCLYGLILLLFSSSFSATSSHSVTAVKEGSRIDVSVNGQLFIRYNFSPAEKYPYFFPVNGISSASVVSTRNANYPHHSGLFFGCDKVNQGNYWQEGLEEGQIVSLRAEIVASGSDRVVIENECIWSRPGATSPIKDRRIITIISHDEMTRFIDFDIELTMLEEVVIERSNHSLFSARVAFDLSVEGGGTLINAEGLTGETGTFGVASPWMNYGGIRKGRPEGIAIFQHPANRWYPSPWFTRDYGFFSPTPLYWLETPDQHARFAKDETLRLRYRVVVHAGASLQELFTNYIQD